MSFISIALSVFLLLSLVTNVFLLWYAYRSIQQIRFYDSELTEIIKAMATFANHLSGVYNMETFYGDETLRHLLRHAEEIIKVFDGYDLFSDEEEEFYDEAPEEKTAY